MAKAQAKKKKTTGKSSKKSVTARSAKKRVAKPTKQGHGKKGPVKMSKKNTGGQDQRINVQNRIRATFTGTRTFDRSLAKTNLWLKELMKDMKWENRERALSALRASLHALRDILPLQEVIHLGAQLPILIRGVYYESWHYSPKPLRLKTIGEFYELVRDKLGSGANKYSTEELRKFTRAALHIITKHVSAGEMYEVKSNLKEKLRDLIDVSFEELEAQSHREIRRGSRKSQASREGTSARSAKKKLQRDKAAHQERLMGESLQPTGIH